MARKKKKTRRCIVQFPNTWRIFIDPLLLLNCDLIFLKSDSIPRKVSTLQNSPRHRMTLTDPLDDRVRDQLMGNGKKYATQLSGTVSINQSACQLEGALQTFNNLLHPGFVFWKFTLVLFCFCYVFYPAVIVDLSVCFCQFLLPRLGLITGYFVMMEFPVSSLVTNLTLDCVSSHIFSPH